MRGFLGWLMLLLLAYALSESRHTVPWRIVNGRLLPQVARAVLLITVEPAREAILLLNGAVEALQRATIPPFCSATWVAGRCRSPRSAQAPA